MFSSETNLQRRDLTVATTLGNAPSRAEEVDLARPFTSGRLRLYLAIGSVQGLVTLLCAVGVGADVLEPTRTLDVVANIFNFIPMVLLPVLVLVLVRDRTTRDAELILVWLPFTAAAQLSFELVWLVGQPLEWWQSAGDPGWTWMWWQFALADTRYFGENPYIFALELSAVVVAVAVLVAFRQLVRTDLSDRARISNLYLGGLGLVVLTVNTLFYFASTARNGFADIGQGDYGMLKLVALNSPYLFFPILVLIAIGRQIDHLYARAARPFGKDIA